jgi:hypothetical protein
MNLLLRAIITGFGLRLGSEIAKKVTYKLRADGEGEDDGDAEGDDDELGSITPDPPVV